MENAEEAPIDVIDEEINHELHMFWWLHLPVLFYVFRYGVHLFTDMHSGLESYFLDELGVVENLTVIILLLALICTLSVLIRFGKSVHFLLKAFLLFYCLGCIYFAGEEASWGQHWFGWQTGEFFLEHNDQQETNFHNTSHLLDRTPKGIVSGLILIGGVFVPLLFYYKAWRVHHGSRFWWVWPTWICMPTAIITTITTIPSKIEHWTGMEFYFNGAQEMKECYIAYFILLYIISLGKRLHLFHGSGESVAAQW